MVDDLRLCSSPSYRRSFGRKAVAQRLSSPARSSGRGPLERVGYNEGFERDLDEFMAHYNLERSHQGYRLNGRTPAQALGISAMKLPNLRFD